MAAHLSVPLERFSASPATYFKLIATAALWGATWVAARIAVSEAAPLAVASWRFLLAALVLGALLVVREGWPRWSLGEWLTLTALGATGIFLYNVCFLYGMTKMCIRDRPYADWSRTVRRHALRRDAPYTAPYAAGREPACRHGVARFQQLFCSPCPQLSGRS